MARGALGGMVPGAGSLKPIDLPWNASSCHHRVAWGQSLLSKPQFPPQRVWSTSPLETWAVFQRYPWKAPSTGLSTDQVLHDLYFGPAFPFLLDLGTL